MDGHDSRNKGHPMGFPRNKLKKREESRSSRNSRDTGSDFKVGEGQRRPSTSAEMALKDSGTGIVSSLIQIHSSGRLRLG